MAEVGRIRSKFELEIAGFQRSMRRMQQNLDRVQQELQQTGRVGTRALTSVERSASRTSNTFRSLRNAVAGYLSLRTARAIFDQAVAMENLNIQLETVFGSQERANAAFARVNAIADETGSRLLNIAQGYVGIQAAAEGSSLAQQEVDRIFRSLIISGRALGRSNVEIAGALRQVGQAISGPRVQWEELNIIFENLQGIQGLFQRNLDGTTRNLREMTKAGADARQVFLPFAAEAERRFAPAMERLRNSTQAALNDILNAWDRFVKELVDSGALEAVRDGILALADAWKTVSQAFGTDTESRLERAQARLFQLGEQLNNLRRGTGMFDFLSPLGVQTSAEAFEQENARLRTAIAEQVRIIEDLDRRVRARRQQQAGTGGLGGGRRGTPQLATSQQLRDAVAGVRAAGERQLGLATFAGEQELRQRSEALQVYVSEFAVAQQTVSRSFQVTAGIIRTTFETVGQTFAQLTIGVLRGTQTMQQALGSLAESLAASFLNQGIQTLLGLGQTALLGALAPSPGVGTGAASGSPSIFGGPGGLLGRGISIINVPDASAASGVSAQEAAQGRSVITNTITAEFARGNSSPLVRTLRQTLGR